MYDFVQNFFRTQKRVLFAIKKFSSTNLCTIYVCTKIRTRVNRTHKFGTIVAEFAVPVRFRIFFAIFWLNIKAQKSQWSVFRLRASLSHRNGNIKGVLHEAHTRHEVICRK